MYMQPVDNRPAFKRMWDDIHNVFQKISESNYYGLNDWNAIASLILLIATTGTALYTGYTYAQHHSFILATFVSSLFAILGAFESLSLLMLASAIYWKRYGLALLLSVIYSSFAFMGLITTTISLSSGMSSGLEYEKVQKDKLTEYAEAVKSYKNQLDNLNAKESEEKEKVHLKFNPIISKSEVKMTSSSGKVLDMSDDGNWLQYCLPGMHNMFTGDKNCSEVQSKLSFEYEKVTKKISEERKKLEGYVRYYENEISTIRLDTPVSFDTILTTTVKGDMTSRDLVELSFAICMIAAMWYVTINKYRMGHMYKLDPPPPSEREFWIATLWGWARNRLDFFVHDSNLIMEKKKLEKDLENAQLRARLQMINASLTTTNSVMVNSQSISNTVVPRDEFDHLFDSAMRPSNNLSEIININVPVTKSIEPEKSVTIPKDLDVKKSGRDSPPAIRSRLDEMLTVKEGTEK